MGVSILYYEHKLVAVGQTCPRQEEKGGILVSVRRGFEYTRIRRQRNQIGKIVLEWLIGGRRFWVTRFEMFFIAVDFWPDSGGGSGGVHLAMLIFV